MTLLVFSLADGIAISSLSIDDTPGGGRGGSPGPEDDEDGEITLDQFLKECDQSPKSRVGHG